MTGSTRQLRIHRNYLQLCVRTQSSLLCSGVFVGMRREDLALVLICRVRCIADAGAVSATAPAQISLSVCQEKQGGMKGS
jgi:hypothetical protein